MSRPIDLKAIETKLREAREADLPPEMYEERKAYLDQVYKDEFQRLIFHDMGKQAGDLYLRQVKGYA